MQDTSISPISPELPTASASEVENKVQCLIEFLAGLNPKDFLHSDKIAKTTDVFEKYRECLLWLFDAYKERRLEEMLGCQIDPIIEREHDDTIQKLISQKLLHERCLEIVHKER